MRYVHSLTLRYCATLLLLTTRGLSGSWVLVLVLSSLACLRQRPRRVSGGLFSMLHSCMFRVCGTGCDSFVGRDCGPLPLRLTLLATFNRFFLLPLPSRTDVRRTNSRTPRGCGRQARLRTPAALAAPIDYEWILYYTSGKWYYLGRSSKGMGAAGWCASQFGPSRSRLDLVDQKS